MDKGSYAALAATAREAVIVIDASARVVEWNAAAGLMFGFGRHEAIGRSIGHGDGLTSVAATVRGLCGTDRHLAT